MPESYNAAPCAANNFAFHGEKTRKPLTGFDDHTQRSEYGRKNSEGVDGSINPTNKDFDGFYFEDLMRKGPLQGDDLLQYTRQYGPELRPLHRILAPESAEGAGLVHSITSTTALCGASPDLPWYQQNGVTDQDLIYITDPDSRANGLKFEANANVVQIDHPANRVQRLRKAVAVSAKWLEINAPKRINRVMVTLTYRGVDDWRRNHIATYLNVVRSWYARLRPGFPLLYVWVAELQKRGAVHYHCVFWLDKGVTMPKADKRGWWPHGMTNSLRATKPVGYLMKYVSKTQPDGVQGFPKGCRLYGMGGLGETGRRIKRWNFWPGYMKNNCSINDRFKRRVGGGFINKETGQVFLSEFAPLTPDFCWFIRVRRHERLFPADGAFSWISDRPAGYEPPPKRWVAEGPFCWLSARPKVAAVPVL